MSDIVLKLIFSLGGTFSPQKTSHSWEKCSTGKQKCAYYLEVKISALIIRQWAENWMLQQIKSKLIKTGQFRCLDICRQLCKTRTKLLRLSSPEYFRGWIKWCHFLQHWPKTHHFNVLNNNIDGSKDFCMNQPSKASFGITFSNKNQ